MHKFLIRSFVSSLVLLFTLTVAAVAKDVKAAFVYIGPTGDHGWTCLLYTSPSPRDRG